MIKRFCDCCGSEMFAATQAMQTSIGSAKTSIFISVGMGVIQSGGGGVALSYSANPSTPDYCKYCILSAVARLDDRPRAA